MAPDEALTPAAERLITRHIDSMGALDLLLLVHRTRDRDWSLAGLCAELRCPSAWAVSQLRVLDSLGLVMQPAPGRHRYVHGRQYGPAVDAIARVHRRDPALVTKLVLAKPSRREELAG